MKRLIYGGLIVGALLALYGLIPSNSESKLYYKNKSNLEEVVLEKLEPKTKLEERIKKVFSDTKIKKPYVNISDLENTRPKYIYLGGKPLNYNNFPDLEDIKDVLRRDCKDNCLYSISEGGNIIRHSETPITFYEPDTDCHGMIVRDGWVLLDGANELMSYGRNESDETYPKPEELIEWHCMTGK